VFTAASTQEDVFRREGVLAAERVMSGFPASILAYGTAGSGKTHTLFGPRENPGVGPQCVASLLKMAGEASRADAEQPLVQVSCYELHHNAIYDLLVGKHHEVQFGGKDDLGKTSDSFAKIGINSVEHFWDLVTRLREVSSHPAKPCIITPCKALYHHTLQSLARTPTLPLSRLPYTH